VIYFVRNTVFKNIKAKAKSILGMYVSTRNSEEIRCLHSDGLPISSTNPVWNCELSQEQVHEVLLRVFALSDNGGSTSYFQTLRFFSKEAAPLKIADKSRTYGFAHTKIDKDSIRALSPFQIMRDGPAILAGSMMHLERENVARNQKNLQAYLKY
jgi:hypothetical protein